MGRRTYTDIPFRGRLWPTAQALADHLGLRADTVRLAIRKGRMDRLGSGYTGPDPIPTVCRGVVYPSQTACAAAFGLRPSACSQYLAKHGNLDGFGLGTTPGLIGNSNGFQPRPFSIHGMTFPSMGEASRAIGRGQDYVGQVLRRGGPAARRSMSEAFYRLKLEAVAAKEKARLAAEARRVLEEIRDVA